MSTSGHVYFKDPLFQQIHTLSRMQISVARGAQCKSRSYTMAMSSLISSSSGEGINEWNGANNRKNKHARSASEPDFGSNSKQDSSKETSLSDVESKSASCFGRLGSKLLKTVGWISRFRQDGLLKKTSLDFS